MNETEKILIFQQTEGESELFKEGRKMIMSKAKKRIFSTFLMMLCVCMFSVSAFAASPKINKQKAAVLVGKTITLKISNAGKNKIAWKSSNPKIAAVNRKGLVKGLRAGKAVISARVGKKTLKCNITVKVIKAKNIRLSKTSASVTQGSSITLKAAVYPKNASYRSVVWKSSNKKIATVNSKGVVKAVSPGKVYIMALARDGSRKKAVCTVTVKKKEKAKPVSDYDEYLERQKTKERILKELAAAKKKSPREYIKYCETHAKYLFFSGGRSSEFLRVLMSGDMSSKIDVSNEYRDQVNKIYIPWIYEIMKKAGCDRTKDPLVKLFLFHMYIHSLYRNGTLKYGGRTVPYGLCPDIAPLLMEGKTDGTYRFGNCTAFSMLTGDAAYFLGFEVWFVTPDWGGSSHIATKVKINGCEYIFDTLWGICEGLDETAKARLDKAGEECNRILNQMK